MVKSKCHGNWLKAIVEHRINEPIKSTKDLNDLLTPFFPPTKVNKFLVTGLPS